MDVVKGRYQVLHDNTNLKSLLESLNGWIATFDDHDFGVNNADKTFPFRNESQDLFWKFTSTVDIGAIEISSLLSSNLNTCACFIIR